MTNKTAQTKKCSSSRISSLESLLKAKKDRVGKAVGGEGALANRPREKDAISRSLQERLEALRKAREDLTAAFIKLDSLHCNAKNLEGKPLVARADVALQ